MSNQNDKQQWKETSGFADDTAVAQIVCKEDELEKWDEEASGSRSKYLYTLIQEARAYRKHGFGGGDGSQARVQELEDEVERLQRLLEERDSDSTDSIRFEASTLKQDVLTDQYQSLEEILRRIIESGMLDEALRQPVENQLYFLAAQDEVVFERGFGWKLVDGDGGAV